MTSSAGLFQESVVACLGASVQSLAAQDSQGNLSPVEVHLSNPDSSSLLVEATLVDKQHGASGYLSDIHLAPETNAEQARQAQQGGTYFILSDGFPRPPLTQIPVVPCSPLSPDFSIIMETHSVPSSSPMNPQKPSRQKISPMCGALSLPTHSSTLRVGDIGEWILASPNSRSREILRSSPSPSTMPPERPPRPLALEDAVLHDILVQWIEVESSNRCCGSKDEEDSFVEHSPTESYSYNYAFHASTTEPGICEREQDEVSGIVASAPMLRCPVVTDTSISGGNPIHREDTPPLCMASHDMDFFDVWTPPPPHSPSPSSSLDHSFHLDLFSPASKERLTSSMSVWNSMHVSPIDPSSSPGFYSSSPFVGWSSVSPPDTKFADLPTAVARISFNTVALHQPQPIRPIPPIPIPSLFQESSPAPEDTSCF